MDATDEDGPRDEGPIDGDDPTDTEVACFEAGIKFGSLYHQFAGTPISPASANSIADAIGAAIENQPYCESAEVALRTDVLQDAIDAADADYVELTGRFLDVELTIDYEGVTVRADMVMDGDYPRMRVRSVERP